MIIFEKIRFKNFLSYGNTWTELDLATHKDTLIVGENGAGKSTFLDALSYALYMKPFRKVNNPQLVNSVNKKHLKVEVEFRVGSNSFKVCRGHAPRTFEVYQNGELLNQDAHTKDYQKILEQNILKMNYKSFTQIVVLGSRNFVPFMQLSTTDRRTVIEDLLDIQIFSVMAALLKDKIAINKNELQDIDYQLNLLDDKVKVQEDYISKVQENKDAQLQEIKDKIDETSNQIDEHKLSLETFIGEADSLYEQCEPLESVSNRVQQFLTLEGQIEKKLTKLRKQLKFYQDNHICDTCGQEIPDDYREEKAQESNTAISETTSGLTKLEEEIQSNSERIETLKDIQNEAKAKEKQAENERTSITILEDIHQGLNNEIAEKSFEASDQEEAYARLKHLKEDKEEYKTKRVDLRRKQAVFDTARTLLMDTGIKSRIIKQYVPVMNKLINKYLAAMEFFVDFNLDEDFKETIRSRHRDEFVYASFSEGEKMRIDLALLFTWRAIAKLKNSASTNILIMDEIFDSSLDTQGTDEFLKIIKELTSDTNIIIISHKTDQLLDKFSNVVRFEKYKNFSRIVE